MQQQQFLLYGANGYTGELIARLAKTYQLTPILAGRNEAIIRTMAAELGLPFRIFELQDTAALHAALAEVTLVVHAAGPYHITARPMVEACIATGTHYIDLNGDLSVFTLIHDYDAAAQARGIMLLPGAGFDVVPTDCIAVALKKQLPDACSLQIAFKIVGSSLSRGTAISTAVQLGQPSAVRRGGVLTPEPVGKRGLTVDFPGYPSFFAMSIPWGDINTAWYSTGIPHIETYTAISKATWWILKGQRAFNWLLRKPAIRRIINSIILQLPAGPNEATRLKAVSLIYGKATNASGDSRTMRLQCSEAYAFTADAVLVISRKILSGDYKAGYQTPGTAYGEGLMMEVGAKSIY